MCRCKKSRWPWQGTGFAGREGRESGKTDHGWPEDGVPVSGFPACAYRTYCAYCAAGNPCIVMPGLMPFDSNQFLLISSAYTPLLRGQ